MNGKIYSSIFVLLTCASVSCAEGKKDNGCGIQDPAKMPVAKEVKSLEVCALKGSPEAAMRLSLWYLNSEDGGLYWTKIAAENGSATGQFNYAMALLRNPSQDFNGYRARYWLERSAAQGSRYAKEQLEEMREPSVAGP